jgi:hypothetical protein
MDGEGICVCFSLRVDVRGSIRIGNCGGGLRVFAWAWAWVGLWMVGWESCVIASQSCFLPALGVEFISCRSVCLQLRCLGVRMGVSTRFKFRYVASTSMFSRESEIKICCEVETRCHVCPVV